MQFIESVGENTIINISGKLDFTTAGVFMEELKTYMLLHKLCTLPV